MAKQKVEKATQDKEANGFANPFEKTIPVAVCIRIPGDNRKVQNGKVTADADADMYAAYKKIYKCPEYSAVTQLASEIRVYLERKEVPGGQRLFRRGTYPIPVTSLEDVDDVLEQFQGEFNKRVEAFLKVYDERKAEALKRLRSLGDASDYPSLQRVRNAFAIEYEYLTFGPPEALNALNRDLYKREMAKVKESCQKAIDEVRLALRSMFQKLLDHMVERLSPGDGGEKKIFKDTLVGNMKEFIADFQDRNITDDAELSAVIDKCKSLLRGKSPDSLRQDDFTRNETAKALAAIKDNVDKMIEKMPVRQIQLDD